MTVLFFRLAKSLCAVSYTQYCDHTQLFLAKAGSLSGTESGEDLRSLLIKAGDILAPDCFNHTLPRPTLSVSSSSKKGSVTKVAHEVRVILEDKGRKLADYNLAREQAGEFVKALEKNKDRQR